MSNIEMVHSEKPTLKVILIGGSSHVGKSTVAESLAAILDWTHVSTDRLSRHPGRPWKQPPEIVPADVADHYLNLSVDELIKDVLSHYQFNIWPKVEAIIASRSNDPTRVGIVIEGSAIWPESVSSLNFNNVAALWLTADEETLRQRIYASSKYSTKRPRERLLVDKFLDRTLTYNTRMIDDANRHNFNLIDVQHSNVPELAARCLSKLGIITRCA